MTDAITQFYTTESSKCTQASDNAHPPEDWPLHPLIDEGYPPGSAADWFMCTVEGDHFFAKVDPALIQTNFYKTGADGVGIMHYSTTLFYTANALLTVCGYVNGIAVTTEKKFILTPGVARALWLHWPENCITANAVGGIGYLLKAEFELLEFRGTYSSATGAPDEEVAPRYIG